MKKNKNQKLAKRKYQETPFLMQIDFWPEEIRIRDIDRIDVSTIDDWNRYKETDHVARSWSFSDITKGKYFIYKNRWKKSTPSR
jgi:hypothetical protein